MSHGEWAWPAAIAVACVAASAVAIADSLAPREPDTDANLERACLLAAGNARIHASWLVPGHSRREAGLLLLSSDAAWAPVCAKDAAAGARLRDQILDAVARPDAPNAYPLAQHLVEILDAP